MAGKLTERQIMTLIAALKPFARRAKDWGDSTPNSQFLNNFLGGLTVGDLRRARRALEQSKE